MGKIRNITFTHIFPKRSYIDQIDFAVALSLGGTFLFVKLINFIKVKEVILSRS